MNLSFNKNAVKKVLQKRIKDKEDEYVHLLKFKPMLK